MWDAIRGYGKAPSSLVAHRYRSEFKLSHKEFMDEPYDILINNLKIMELDSAWAEDKSKRQQMKYGSK